MDEYRTVIRHIAGGESRGEWHVSRASAEAQMESMINATPSLLHSARFAIETRTIIVNRYTPRVIRLADLDD